MNIPMPSSTQKPLKAMIVAGGTGGHVFPGLAIAEQLISQGWEVMWVGTEEGMESTLVRDRGLAFEAIPMVGLRGKGIIRFLLLPLIILRAFCYSIKILRQHKPNMVIGMGGYVAFGPPMMAAALGIPVAIHEQNAISGLVNRVLAPIADLRFCGFPHALAKAQYTGNPVLKSVLEQPLPEMRFKERKGPLKVLVVGGSRGAVWMNDKVPSIIAAIPEQDRPIVIHQAGAGREEHVRAAYEALEVKADVRAFIEDMAQAYAEADLVICRAGAMTVSELAAIGVASILIPFPYAVDDHQYANAQYLAEAEAACLFRQEEVTKDHLVLLLQNLTRKTCLKMANCAKSLSPGNAALQIASVCQEYVLNRKQREK